MAARGFDLYDLTSPFVSPTAPAAPAITPPATRATERMFRAGAYLLTLAGVLLLAALLVALTPIGRIDADVTVPFVAMLVAALALIAWRVRK